MNDIDICKAIQEEIGELFTCSERGDYYRVRTPYLYPDGDNIDLFCEVTGDTVTVTDLAETTGWLRTQSIATRRSPNQNRLIGDICTTHGVEFYRGMLQARCRVGDDLSGVFTRVAQAALRVSDLSFTFRYRGSESVTTDVAEFLADHRLEYERAQRLSGRSLRVWNVDFHVRAIERSSLVYVLSTGSRAAANRITDHVVAAWYDLSHYAIGPEGLQFISLFDDTADVWADEAFRRVEDLSKIARWSSPDEFIGILSMLN
jgi:hypothetical protein